MKTVANWPPARGRRSSTRSTARNPRPPQHHMMGGSVPRGGSPQAAGHAGRKALQSVW